MKRYRVYYNRAYEWPQCWSVDEGTQGSEINVIGYLIEGCRVESKTLRQHAQVKRKNEPFAWLEVDGVLNLRNGMAVFTPE